jgi:hypothetical protein
MVQQIKLLRGSPQDSLTLVKFFATTTSGASAAWHCRLGSFNPTYNAGGLYLPVGRVFPRHLVFLTGLISSPISMDARKFGENAVYLYEMLNNKRIFRKSI